MDIVLVKGQYRNSDSSVDMDNNYETICGLVDVIVIVYEI